MATVFQRGPDHDPSTVSAGSTPPLSGTTCRRQWASILAFRVVFCYFTLYNLYNFPYLAETFPGGEPVARFYDRVWGGLIQWLSQHLLHITVSTAYTGSQDRTYDYVQNGLVVLLALFATLLWSIWDRRWQNDPFLKTLLRIELRYALGLTMVWFGAEKIIPGQFFFPPLLWLVEPHGEASPIRLFMIFMGYSKAYNVFAGTLEFVGGFLLFFRRTTLLGALLLFSVLANILALNFCFDIDLKLASTNLLLMASYLLLPDLGRLTRFLLGNGAVTTVPPETPWTGRWRSRTAMVVKYAVILAAVGSSFSQAWIKQGVRGDRRPKPPLYGLYEVEQFTRNGQTIPPLLGGDGTRWRWAMFEWPDTLSIRTMGNSLAFIRIHVDMRQKVITIPTANTKNPEVLTFQQPDQDHLVLTGRLQGSSLEARLKRRDASTFRLVNHGFHWVTNNPAIVQ